MSVVSYNSQRIIPVQTVSISVGYDRAETGEKLSKNYTLVISGTLLAFKGSPDSNGEFYSGSGATYPADEDIPMESRLGAILRKIQAIKKLFSDDNKEFYCQSSDASAPMRCIAWVESIEFSPGPYVDKAEYQVTLKTNNLFITGQEDNDDFDFLISSASETWEFSEVSEPEDENISRYYNLSHKITAQGKDLYSELGELTSRGFEQAKGWCSQRIGFDSSVLSNSFNEVSPSYGHYNHSRTTSYDEIAGSFDISESWVLTTSPCTEVYSINISKNIESNTTVSLEAEYNGFETRNTSMDITQTKYEAALARYNASSGLFYSRAINAYGGYLNYEPVTQAISMNPANGRISANFDYNDRPSQVIDYVAGEFINLSDGLSSDKFAEIFVLGRRNGPIIQDLQSQSSRTRNLSYECTVPRSSGLNLMSPLNNPSFSGQLQSLVSQVRPTEGVVMVAGQSANYSPSTGRFSYTCDWIYSN